MKIISRKNYYRDLYWCEDLIYSNLNKIIRVLNEDLVDEITCEAVELKNIKLFENALTILGLHFERSDNTYIIRSLQEKIQT